MRFSVSACAAALIVLGGFSNAARAQHTCTAGTTSTGTGTTSTGTGVFTTNRVSPFSTGLTAAQISAIQQAMLFRQMQQAALQQQLQQAALQRQMMLQAQAQGQFQPNLLQTSGFASTSLASPTTQLTDTSLSTQTQTKLTAAERREARKQLELEKKLARLAVAAEKAAAKAAKSSKTSVAAK